ncbi:hypothetical protein BDV27DRAFT_149788 [Aspergillus caelatus]|uniref:Uncharacterized protein n=1 Tax=Aspergillus caelatus TaxID=61420 RepID=A0A5N6ZSH3_9EURO|nr:uncharacterized protein BDV27DRAFT_149788 [Aspergillus caelatus]KAE8359180.1 hypothetical protein BDV27DRAFT_149788 [Aspergillus caelatus]
MAEPMVILYPATCLTFTAIFLVSLNRESIIYGLIRCAQLIHLGNDYIELHIQTDDTEFESELKDLEDQWPTPRSPSDNSYSTTPSYPSLISTDDPNFPASSPRTPLGRYFDRETGAIYPQVLEPPTPSWEVELRMRIERGVGLEASWDRAVDCMVGLFVRLHV